MNRLALSLCIAMACVSTAYAGPVSDAFKANTAATPQTWSAWGGSIGLRWNNDLLANLGVKLDVAGTTAVTDYRGHQWFDVRQTDGLVFSVRNGSLQQFNGGSLQMRGGYVMHLRDGSTIDLRDFTLRVRASDPRILDMVSSDGKVWFFSDRVMFELADNNRTLAIRAADLRVTAALAARLGAPEAEGWELADIAANTQVNIVGADPQPDRVCTPTPWPNVAVPGHAGSVYQADLFMQSFSVSPTGCQGCTGPNGTGTATFAPSSSLINNKNDGTAVATVAGDPLGTSTALYTANVAWYTKFSGNSAPYSNDQHPFLIWNLYRINANTGVIEQIGKSGVKHAFVTINVGCTDSCNAPHQLGLGCGDTYGVGNNDSPGDMGPRSEIIPATAQWGRCGSIFDPNCDGNQDNNGNTPWTQRLKTPEGKLKHTAGDGITYLFESWYVAREDINIYNSMATQSVNPQFSGSNWSLTGGSNYRLGAALDRWVDPVSPPANSKNSELATTEGHAKVAVKVTALAGGKWRYNYAVQNLDFSRATTSGAEPNLRVLTNRGFDSFGVPLSGSAVIASPQSSVGEENPNMNWGAKKVGDQLTFSTQSLPGVAAAGFPIPSTLPTLDWGSLYSYTFETNTPPVAGNATLHVAQAGSPASYTVPTLVPSAPVGVTRRN